MKIRDIEDCTEDCPFRVHEICEHACGHPDSYRSDPPCARYDKDRDIDEIIASLWAYRAREMKLSEEKTKRELEKKERNKIIQAKRRATLRKNYEANRERAKERRRKRVEQNIKNLAESFRIVNEMLR